MFPGIANDLAFHGSGLRLSLAWQFGKVCFVIVVRSDRKKKRQPFTTWGKADHFAWGFTVDGSYGPKRLGNVGKRRIDQSHSV